MPCNCKKPLPDYPQAENWGPVLWTILHALAQKSGNVSAPCFREDEKRQFKTMIEGLPKIIPCPSCREHAEEWIRAHPIFNPKTISQSELHDWIVDWFYDFHESVNARLEKPSFDKALLAETYGSISIPVALIQLTPFIQTAIRLSGLTLFPWNKWLGSVKSLITYY